MVEARNVIHSLKNGMALENMTLRETPLHVLKEKSAQKTLASRDEEGWLPRLGRTGEVKWDKSG